MGIYERVLQRGRFLCNSSPLNDDDSRSNCYPRVGCELEAVDPDVVYIESKPIFRWEDDGTIGGRVMQTRSFPRVYKTLKFRVHHDNQTNPNAKPPEFPEQVDLHAEFQAKFESLTFRELADNLLVSSPMRIDFKKDPDDPKEPVLETAVCFTVHIVEHHGNEGIVLTQFWADDDYLGGTPICP